MTEGCAAPTAPRGPRQSSPLQTARGASKDNAPPVRAAALQAAGGSPQPGCFYPLTTCRSAPGSQDGDSGVSPSRSAHTLRSGFPSSLLTAPQYTPRCVTVHAAGGTARAAPGSLRTLAAQAPGLSAHTRTRGPRRGTAADRWPHTSPPQRQTYTRGSPRSRQSGRPRQALRWEGRALCTVLTAREKPAIAARSGPDRTERAGGAGALAARAL